MMNLSKWLGRHAVLVNDEEAVLRLEEYRYLWKQLTKLEEECAKNLVMATEEQGLRYKTQNETSKRIYELEHGIKIALDVIDHGDFRNGNTGPNGIIDEGEVHASRMVKRLEILLKGEM